ncbi:hypothetical protein ABEB36_002386 [Hypothenemus hampei]|uniref:Uncharacterized protein n=1 Tax=Hypothenemus hampei TaxID=57062 RepID=A0ABD1F5M9_HYPHA
MVAMLPYLSLMVVLINILIIHGSPADTIVPRTNPIRKRSYYPWAMTPTNSLSIYNAATLYRPAPYTISRPYYIPVYGYSSGHLIFYPPQPLYRNPGVPKDNPIIPPVSPSFFQGPSYLPPEDKKPDMTMNRFGGEDDDDNDRPIWGTSGLVQMSLNGGSSQQDNPVIPTRPPADSDDQRDFPSLMHEQTTKRNEPEVAVTTQQSIAAQNAIRRGPSNCVWAIISCCSAADPSSVPLNCFEQRGCPGPFWGSSPCQGDFARSAIQAATNYYQNVPARK